MLAEELGGRRVPVTARRHHRALTQARGEPQPPLFWAARACEQLHHVVARRGHLVEQRAEVTDVEGQQAHGRLARPRSRCAGGARPAPSRPRSSPEPIVGDVLAAAEDPGLALRSRRSTPRRHRPGRSATAPVSASTGSPRAAKRVSSASDILANSARWRRSATIAGSTLWDGIGISPGLMVWWPSGPGASTYPADLPPPPPRRGCPDIASRPAAARSRAGWWCRARSRRGRRAARRRPPGATAGPSVRRDHRRRARPVPGRARLALVVAIGPTRAATARTSSWSGTRSPIVWAGLAEAQVDVGRRDGPRGSAGRATSARRRRGPPRRRRPRPAPAPARHRRTAPRSGTSAGAALEGEQPWRSPRRRRRAPPARRPCRWGARRPPPPRGPPRAPRPRPSRQLVRVQLARSSDHGVEPVARQDTALSPHVSRAVAQQAAGVGLAGAPLPIPRSGPDRHPLRCVPSVVVALAAQGDRDERAGRPVRSRARAGPCPASGRLRTAPRPTPPRRGPLARRASASTRCARPTAPSTAVDVNRSRSSHGCRHYAPSPPALPRPPRSNSGGKEHRFCRLSDLGSCPSSNSRCGMASLLRPFPPRFEGQ